MTTDKVLKDATKGVNKKQLTSDLGFDVSYLYRQLSGKERNILDQIKPWIKAENGDSILQWLCSENEGFFFKEQEHEAIQDLSIIPKVLDTFSDFFKTFTRSVADGEVDVHEAADCRREVNKLKGILEGFAQAAENGKYRKG